MVEVCMRCQGGHFLLHGDMAWSLISQLIRGDAKHALLPLGTNFTSKQGTFGA
jgi:hypothetical protein